MKKCTLILAILMMNITLWSQDPKRVVLVEESTGTGCQWCPRGDIYGKNLLKAYPDNIAYIAVHAYNSSDPMYNEEYADGLVSLGVTASPSGLINRLSHISMENVNNPGSDLQAYMDENPEANVIVETEYNQENRDLEVTLTADIFQTITGNFRFVAIVVEDGVTGPAPAFEQSNAYSGGNNGPLEFFDQQPSPVPASIMVYNHVGRYLLGGFNGVDAQLPNTLEEGKQYKHDMEWTLPASYDWEYVRVIGVLVDANDGETINAGKSNYLDGNANAKPFFHSVPRPEAFQGFSYRYDIVTHDPEFENLTITKIEGPSWLEFTDNGDGFGNMQGTPDELGDYDVTLELTDGNWIVQQEFTISVGVPTETWKQVGQEAFSHSNPSVLDVEMDDNGNLFAMVSSYDTDLIQVFKLENDLWIQLGNDIPEDSWDAAFAVHPDGTPYVLGKNQVYRYDNSTWVNLGGAIAPGNPGGDPDLAINHQGEIYVAAALLGGSTAPLLVRKWNGNDWEDVGEYVDENIGVWPRIRFDQNDLPLIVYGGGGPYAFYGQAARWNGSEWLDLGDGYFESESYTRWNFDIVECPNKELFAINVFESDRRLHVYHLIDNEWLPIAESLATGVEDFSCSMVADKDNNIYVVYNDFSANGGISCQKYNGEEWIYLGIPGFTNNASKARIILDENGNPIVGYQDISSGDKMSVKRYVDLTSHSFEISQKDIQFELFPNPANDYLKVQSEFATQFRIYSIFGNEILIGEMSPVSRQSNQQINIDISSLNRGIYFFHISDGIRNSIKKFIKE